MSTSIINKEPWSGRFQKENNSVVNIADILAVLFSTCYSLKTMLTISSIITATTQVAINASGTGVIKSGDVIYLGVNAVAFNANTNINIFCDGVLLKKGVDVIWVNTYTVYFIAALAVGSVIIITKASKINSKIITTNTIIAGGTNIPQVITKHLETSTNISATNKKTAAKNLTSNTKTTTTAVKVTAKNLTSNTKTTTTSTKTADKNIVTNTKTTTVSTPEKTPGG